MYDENEKDELYAKAVIHVRTTGKVSISNVQRNFVIGYNRAARLIERMEIDGVVSAADCFGIRTVLKGCSK